jgi:hypothetical protein
LFFSWCYYAIVFFFFGLFLWLSHDVVVFLCWCVHCCCGSHRYIVISFYICCCGSHDILLFLVFTFIVVSLMIYCYF